MQIRRGYEHATLIDVILTNAELQQSAIAFNIQIAKQFATQPSSLGTTVLLGLDGSRNATYAHWKSVDAFLTTVRDIQGKNIPALAEVETLSTLNEVLQDVGKGMGSSPEYHAYEVFFVLHR